MAAEAEVQGLRLDGDGCGGGLMMCSERSGFGLLGHSSQVYLPNY